MKLLIFLSSVCLARCQQLNPSELAVLEEFYNSTNGPGWRWRDTQSYGEIWSFTGNSNLDPCQDKWQGIICDCNMAPCVVFSLILEGYSLAGNIPNSIGSLSYIDEISLNNNSITGSLPRSLGNCSFLRILDLDFNHLEAAIPSSFASLSQSLTVLRLHSNRFTGSLPNILGTLSELTVLSLGRNKFSGRIPSGIGFLLKLDHLNFGKNSLSGRIPPEILTFPLIRMLNISRNLLSGSVPSGVVAMTALIYFDFSRNCLSGSIPLTLFQLPRLESLLAEFNKLSGLLPSSIPATASVLGTLRLDHNSLEGSIPSAMGQLRGLKTLMLDFNCFDNSLPSALCSFSQLSIFSIFTNYFTNVLPSCLSELSGITLLDMGNNKLSGPIHSFIDNSKSNFEVILMNINKFYGPLPLFSTLSTRNIRILNFQNNSLYGTLPSAIGSLTRLRGIDLAGNLLYSSIPSEIQYCSSLVLLELSENYFSGKLPIIQPNSLAKLAFIRIADNLISSSIPSSIGRLTSLRIFYLWYNCLTGTLPSEMVSLTKMAQLSLDRNQLTGTIPQFISNWTLLKGFYIAQNYFTGSIPTQLLSARDVLESLLLNNNYLTGELPSELSLATRLKGLAVDSNYFYGDPGKAFSTEMTDLAQIDIGDNNFDGTLPEIFFRLPALQTLSATKNCFQGTLPESICEATSLTSIGFDGLASGTSCSAAVKVFNVFTMQYVQSYLLSPILGTIPPCIFLMKSLKALHLSGNGLSGPLPEKLHPNSTLSDISLSYNLLTGTISPDILTFPFEYFDLSYNKIRGSVDNIATNDHVTLRQNRLSGKIPSSILKAQDVDILLGNMFECSRNRDLPVNDPYKAEYSCGSNALHYSFITWGVTTIVCSLYYYLPNYNYSKLISFINEEALNYIRLANRISEIFEHTKGSELVVFVNRLLYARTSLVYCACLAWFIFMPIFILIKLIASGENSAFIPMYEEQYAWTVSGVYLSGYGSAVMLLILWMIFIGTVVTTMGVPNFVVESKGSGIRFLFLNKSSFTSITLNSIKLALIIAVNMAIVLAVNGIYIYGMVSSVEYQVKALFQILMTAFNALWDRVVISYFVSGFYEKKHWMLLFFFTHSFNLVIAPVLSSAFIDNNCFKNFFSDPSVIVSTYYYGYCTFAVSENDTLVCSGYKYVAIDTEFAVPIVYNYSCMSSLITRFTPVLMYYYAVQCLIIPLIQLLIYLSVHTSDSAVINRLRLLPETLLNSIPFLLQKPDLNTLQQLIENSVDIFNGPKLHATMLVNVLVAITFGIVFPPLAVVVCITAILQCGIFIEQLHQYVCWDSARSSLLDDMPNSSVPASNLLNEHNVFRVNVKTDRQSILNIVLNKTVSNTLLDYSVAIISLLWISAIFYSCLIIEASGDVLGWRKSIWILCFTLGIPSMITVCSMVYLKYGRQSEARISLSNPFFEMILLRRPANETQISSSDFGNKQVTGSDNKKEQSAPVSSNII